MIFSISLDYRQEKNCSAKLEIEDMGFSVYVDWVEDIQLNRSKVNKETALLLRQRIKNCKRLIDAFSKNAGEPGRRL